MIMKNDRQKAIENLLNDDVQKIVLGLYLWRNKYYEVLPYSLVYKRHNWNSFIKIKFNNKIYMMREASDDVIQKYYPYVWSAREIEKSTQLNPKLIEKG